MRWLSHFNQQLGQRLLENRWLFIVLLSAFAFIFESSEILLGVEAVDAQSVRLSICGGLVVDDSAAGPKRA
jgi:hypothetical protein